MNGLCVWCVSVLICQSVFLHRSVCVCLHTPVCVCACIHPRGFLLLLTRCQLSLCSDIKHRQPHMRRKDLKLYLLPPQTAFSFKGIICEAIFFLSVSWSELTISTFPDYRSDLTYFVLFLVRDRTTTIQK